VTAQETTSIPTFARFAFTEYPPSPLVDHLPYLAAPEFAGVAAVIKGLLVCSAGTRMAAEAARRVILMSVGGGERLLRPVGEADEGEDGFVGEERWEGQTLGEWLAPFL